MKTSDSPKKIASLAIDQALRQAIAHHQAGRLQDAERLYRAILQTQPNHPDANHNLGGLLAQVKQPAVGLSYLKAALAANPKQGQYWLSFIDVLIQTGSNDVAKQVLAQGRQLGLSDEEIKLLAASLEGNAQLSQAAEQADADRYALKESLPAIALQDSQTHPQIKTDQPKNTVKKPAHHRDNNPDPQEVNSLEVLFSEGRYPEVATLAQSMTVRYPLYGMGWKALGTALQQMGRNADALAPLQKAAELLPGDAEMHNNLGVTLRNLGRIDDAVASYRLVLEIKPGYVGAYNNLGNALRDLGQLDDAVESYRRALEIKPDYAEAHNNLGTALRVLGRGDDAVVSYRQSLEINPDFAEAHHNLGNALKDLGQLDDAVASYRRALEIKPDYARAYNNLGTTLQDLGKLDDAVASYRLALKIKPDFAEAHCNLGNALRGLGQLDASVMSYRRALEVKPDYARAYNNLGIVLQDLGQHDNAVASIRQSLEINPDYANMHSNLLFCLNHCETVDAQALFAEHCRFGERFETPLRALWPQHNNSRNSERCLQVGFVSPDLCQHAVASYIEPVLAHLAGYPQLSLHAYYNRAVEDSFTQRLRKHLKHWHPIAGMSNEMLAQKIRDDAIDILIDLSGHTANHRLLTFARKPAPVQVSWIGYPGTTGLCAMDYYLIDRFVLPIGQFDDQFTEKLVYLPATAPFQPFASAPPVNTLPALSNGYVTFGSFNRPNKISRSVIALWSQLLRALPNARMVLGSMPPVGENNPLLEWFVEEGITLERLSFHPKCKTKEYLGLHHQVDMCLDTFPYNGSTTTAHALWMGVPTLTLAGQIASGRAGGAWLAHLGLDVFVAHNKTEFVERGLYWADHLGELGKIRDELRVRFEQSVVGQPDVIAAALERALRMMWRRWCDGLPAESFEVHQQSTGNVLQKEMGQNVDTLAPLQKAAAQSPDNAEAYYNLGNALIVQGQIDSAVASYRRALEIKPDYAGAYSNLGNALKNIGQLDEAVANYRRALEIKPDFAEAQNNLGAALKELGQLDEAVASYRRALEIKPDYAGAYNNLGAALQYLGQLDEAVANYRLAVKIKPDFAEAYNNLGAALKDLGQLDDAVASYRMALKIKPDYAGAHNNLGTTLKDLGQLDEAVASYRRALQIKPDYAEAHNNLGAALKDLGQHDNAVASYCRALEIKPDYANAHHSLGVVLLDLGQHDNAVASIRRALEIKPDSANAHSSLLFCLNHSEVVDAQALFAEHCRFGERFESQLRALWPQHSNSRKPERCLQVGFVSADLFQHAVANYIEPVLAHLAGHPQLSLHAYYNRTTEDNTTRRLRQHLTHWNSIVGMSDEALAQKIRDDAIDILIDLSGHTANHRLLTFARKPAPVQVSWIGYPGTTGLCAMDYYLIDRFVLPPGQFDDQFTEKLVYLPATAPFMPFADAPPVNTLPALSNGYITFGSFNRPNKISRSVIALWSQLLRALPTARMVLGAMPSACENSPLLEWFVQEGIALERLSFHPKCKTKEYLGFYHQVDICLDAFPYNGSTTTAHALWMGVPTLTLAGQNASGRAGLAWLGHLGLDAFVAHNKTEFVERGLYWADHLDELGKIRDELRVRFEQSVLGRPDVIAAALERALRMMWRRWCAGLPAESFEVHQQGTGNALQKEGGRNADVLVHLQKAAALSPGNAEVHYNMGNALKDLGRFDDAVASYRLSLEIKPDFAEVYNNLGNVLKKLRQLDEAVASYRRALEIKPDCANVHNNLGATLQDLGQLDDAVASYRQSLEIKPDCAEAHNNLGNALKELGQLDDAVANYRLALEIKPDFVEAHNNLGIALQDLGRLDDAVASYRLAVKIKPDFAEAHYNLGNALRNLRQLDEAVSSCRRALEIKPDYADAHNSLGVALLDLGQHDDAVASCRRALGIKPDYVNAHSCLLFSLSHSEAVDTSALFAEHCRFGELFEPQLRALWPQHSNLRNPERCLQVGFVSADLRQHAVANYIEPVLAHLAGYPQLSLHAYYNRAIEDNTTRRLRMHLTHWHSIVGMSDDVLAQKIRDDAIDILIDLSGHTANHRLLTFARKPAPVQVSWIGYPGTTGLSAMDYYLADRFLLPFGQFDDQFTEKLVYLPATAPFLPFVGAPPVNTLPALSNGYVTFGSFNRPNKISRSVITLWSQLLRVLPNARMVLGAMPHACENNPLLEWFVEEGIALERLSFYPRSQMEDYLELHHQIDICLDTFPYNGSTTTAHALWMGVPTLTLAGQNASGRAGLAWLGHLGLEAFVAHNKTEFVERGLYWADHLGELGKIRDELRGQFKQSVLGQPDVIAAALERALRMMWQRWCAGLPAESFEVHSQNIGNVMQKVDS